MSVNIEKFRKEPQLAGLTREEAKGSYLGEAVRLQDNAAVIFDKTIEAKTEFGSLAHLRSAMSELGFVTSYVRPDTDIWLQFQVEGTPLPDAAVLFLHLVTQVTKEIPEVYLGTLMIAYTSEAELEWEETISPTEQGTD